MKLITEQYDQLEVISEASGDKKNLFISGIFMQAETKNRNKRIYPKAILEAAVEKYNTEQVVNGRAVGELNHPAGPSINLDKVSHLITELKWEGNNVIGKAKILDTPMGQIARGLLEGGVRLGVSSRGMGAVNEKNGVSYVAEGFLISTVDIVQDPSAPSAFVNGIMEGVNWQLENEEWIARNQEEIERKIKTDIDETTRIQLNAFSRLLENAASKL